MTDPTPEEAQAALASLEQSRARLAREMEVPFLRHLAFAAIVAIMVLAVGLRALQGLAPLGVVGLVLLIQWDRRRYGVFINGYRRGATLPLTLGLFLFMVAAMSASLWGREHGHPWIGFASAGASFLVALGASYGWHAIYRREMGA